MEEYASGNGYRYGVSVLYVALTAISAWAILGSTGPIKVLSFVMVGVWLSGLVGVFRYKIILGENYIERVYFYRRRVLFKDVAQVVVENQQAFVISSNTKLHISQEISNRTLLLQSLLERLKPFQRVQVIGDYFVISHLRNLENEISKQKDHLASNQPRPSPVHAKLVTKRWLIRAFEISTLSGVYEVAYYGQGMGYECVLVNGAVVDKKNSIFWYVPEFQFRVGDLPAKIKVRFGLGLR